MGSISSTENQYNFANLYVQQACAREQWFNMKCIVLSIKIKRYYIVEIRDLEVELIKGVSTASANAFNIIF